MGGAIGVGVGPVADGVDAEMSTGRPGATSPDEDFLRCVGGLPSGATALSQQ